MPNKLPEISTSQIRAFLDQTLKTGSHATYERKLASLGKFFAWAKKAAYIISNPIEEYLSHEKKPIKAKQPFYSSLQSRIIGKFSGKPKIQDLLYKAFYTRPNWYQTYHSISITNYFHLAILIIFCAAISFGVYDQMKSRAQLAQAYPAAPTIPKRYLSFQGRLTNQYGNPTTIATNMVFKLYDAVTDGNTLWNSGTCSITPDQDGIFSTLLGSDCGAELDNTIFSENAQVWLGVTAGADAEATPRVQIATVAYALNTETLQGLPAGTGPSTIPFIDSTGKLSIAAASPTIESTSGTFAITSQALTISTANTTNGAITINPDGTGTLNLTFEGAAAGGAVNGFVNVTNANITSGALYGGTVASAASGYNFIDFQSGVSPASKFSVSSTGQITTAAGLTIGTTSLSETTAANDSGAYLVGAFDEFDNSASANVQAVLNDLDAAITSGGAGSMWTLGSGVIYPTSATNDFAIGGSTLAASIFGIDESAGNFYFGYDNSANPTLNFEATDADAGEFGFNTNDAFYFSNANVGIGTTNPLQKLHVEGQCVTGDTLLSLKTEGSDPSDISYTRIDQIQGGEKVLSLNETTGKLEPQKIKGLLDMGVKPVFKLKTKSGKEIRTTGNHPYLAVKQTLEGINQEAYKAAVSTGAEVSLERNLNGAKPIWVEESASNSFGGFRMTSLGELEGNINQSAGNHSQNNANLGPNSKISNQQFKVFDIHRPPTLSNINAINKNSIPKNSLAVNNQRLLNVGVTATEINEKPANSVNNPDKTLVSEDFINFSLTHFQQARWTKVIYLQKGDLIAVSSLNSEYVLWDKIQSIEYVGEEQVYDIEVEGTHNFVGNGILAHNTYMSGNVGIGTTGPGTGLHVVGANTDLTPNTWGTAKVNFAVTTNDAYAIDKGGTIGLGGIGDGSNTGVFGAIAGRKSTATIGDASGYLSFHTFNAGLKERMRIQSNGNVGIGTTGPSAPLEVVGDVLLTGGRINALVISSDIAEANAALFEIRNLENPVAGRYFTRFWSDYDNNGAGITERFSVQTNGTTYINGNVGIGTTGPDAKLDSLATTEQLRLTYTDGSVYSSHTVDSSGNLTIDNTGTKTIIADDLQITGADILDTNGNEFLRFTSAASAVNEITLANAATGNGVTLAATGGDAAIALSLDAKGTGALNLNNTATGDILIGGGSGSTGCTITNATGALACAGAVTGSNLSGTNTGDQFIFQTISTTSGTSPVADTTTDTLTLTAGSGITITGNETTDTVTIAATGGISPNSLDFIDFEDTLDLDANLILNQAAYTWVQNFTGTTTTGLTYNANSLTTGTAISLASTSTEGGVSGSSYLLNLARSGINTNASHTAYGLYSAVTNTGTTSTNIAAYLSASGATNNYGLIVNDGSVGIGDASPASLLTVGSGDLFQVNSSGIIAAIDGVAHAIDDVTGDLTLTSNSTSVAIADDLAVNGATSADITSTTGEATLFNTTVTTLSLGGAATTALNLGTGNSAYTAINLGTGTGGNVINIATNNTTKDILNIGSALDDVIINGAGTGSKIDFANFDVATTGNITTAGDLAVNGDDITSDGNLTINATGYTRIGDTATPITVTDDDDDLFVEGDVEVNGGLYLTGKNIYNVVGGVATGAISFAADPTAINNYNSLSYGSWFIQNSTNDGIAALMVDQEKGGDIFTASASGTPKFVITNAGNVGIGTTSPGSKLSVQTTTTDPTTTTYNNYSIHSGVLTADNNNVLYGLYSDVRWDQGGFNATSTSGLRALFGAARAIGASGTVTAALGVVGYVSNAGAGTITNAYALYAYPPANTGGGVITNSYGLHVPANTVGTNIYGISSAIASAANRWNLYISGTADNYIAGNVGIGTAEPQAKLEIAGTGTPGIKIYDADITGAAYGKMHLYQDGSTLRIRSIYANETGTGTIMDLDPTYISFFYGGKVYIKADGNVGIGTTAPGVKLHIVETAAFSTNRLIQYATDNLILEKTGTAALDLVGASIGFGNPSIATIRGAAISSVQTSADADSVGLAFYTHDVTNSDPIVERLRINGAGNVGIGTTGPGSALNIVRTASADDVLLLQDSSGTCEAQPTTTGLTWSCSSDTRLKTNITSPSSVLDYITNIPLRDYTVIKTGEHAMGPIAQEIQQLYPELVRMGDDGYLQVSELTPWQIVKGIQEQQGQITSLSGQLANLSLTDTGDLVITADVPPSEESFGHLGGGTAKYTLQTAAGEIIDRVGAFAEVVAANIRAGAITTKQLAAEGLTAFTATIDNLLINNGLVSPIVQTDLISPLADKSDVVIKIGKSATSGEPVLTPEESYGKLAIQNAEGEEVASIDSQGNASFSGELYAESIASPDLDKIQELLRQVKEDQDLLAQAASWNTNTASESAMANGQWLTANMENLYVTNQAAINSLSISNSLSIGTDLIIQPSINHQPSTINSLTAPLALQSLAMAPIEIMAGKIRIETNGDVTINANLFVAGKIESESIKTKEITTEKLVIAAETTSSSALESSTSGAVKSNTVAGTTVIPAGSTELEIENSKIENSSLIYVTPTSSTENNVLFVKSKEMGKFIVGFTSPIDIDVNFNWWVIQVQN